MLNADALQKLKQLKSDIRSNKEFAEGRVRGSNGKFGFVVLDDGREAFLPPAEMERVFPGDRVRVSLTEEDKGKLSAELDELLESELKFLVGQYVQRGQGHFVQPSEVGLNRWIFLPPKARGKAQPGEFIACKISRHPFRDGKAQAKVETVIGKPDMPGIEHAYVVAQHQLPERFSPAAMKQAEEIKGRIEAITAERTDLSELGFVTIDAPTTLDMDDALAVSKRDSGWSLHIAIADPSCLIEEGSPLDKEAFKRAHSQYLPGETLPMLPNDLCENLFSLVQGELRPALVLHIDIESDGTIGDSRYEFAAIRSRHKLSYEQVANFIEGDDSAVPEDQKESLRNLSDLCTARTAYRASHSLTMEERPDYAIFLNEQRKIERIEKQERNVAQRMVEEAMLAANISVGRQLAAMQQGCFSVHLGFRDERMGEIRSLLKETLPEYADKDLHQLDNYLALVKHLENHSEPQMQDLLAVLKRMLRPGQLANKPGAHLGLGLEAYATVTSPIRKYNDLHNHRVLRAAAQSQQAKALSDEQVEALQDSLIRGRQANRALEQWLYAQYLQDKTGQVFEGKITQVNGAGLGVRLDENGIDGFVRLNGDKKNLPEFDGKYLKLTHNKVTYKLDQPVTVKVSAVDIDKRRIALELVATENA
ncbi:VacB/RNase II family 3'-5' exoribonuclease [Microbulbifer thermotolerans]|uniref:exoribonuclease II n=1 Tax=Microbulbifer thermotolerans TaxID=252514 RepID=A0A143HLC1_MICTH|nr:VacB/RNase II family 3'-5' exoribonuclease [Microbulbifer thermotolerans]AMX02317.1 RNAse R [Microbulbifer thermotolerans]MCX2781758.1 VacB/RNase II family 3'-5' exoribonuclease [Microbulbifer thermotolerans]MCX2832005.1 VacB/RNase II family 3'-5' exoribonuclease [Microbulbifer thermotolerans]